MVYGEEPVGKRVHYLNKALFFLVYLLEGLEIVPSHLLGQKLVQLARILFRPEPKVGTFNTFGEFLDKIALLPPAVMDLWGKPAINTSFPVNRAEDV